MATVDSIETQIKALALDLDALRRENKILREENALLKKWRFGRSSERIEPGQLGFFESEELPPLPEAQAAET